MPLTVRPEPQAPSMVDVTEATLPERSATAMCEVDGTSAAAAAVTLGAPGGVPATASSIARPVEISRERAAR